MHFDEWLLVFSVLLLLSILAWKVSNRLGIPALVLFLVIGMLAGSDGPRGIYFDDALVAQSVGVVALAFILFYRKRRPGESPIKQGVNCYNMMRSHKSPGYRSPDQ